MSKTTLGRLSSTGIGSAYSYVDSIPLSAKIPKPPLPPTRPYVPPAPINQLTGKLARPALPSFRLPASPSALPNPFKLGGGILAVGLVGVEVLEYAGAGAWRDNLIAKLGSTAGTTQGANVPPAQVAGNRYYVYITGTFQFDMGGGNKPTFQVYVKSDDLFGLQDVQIGGEAKFQAIFIAPIFLSQEGGTVFINHAETRRVAVGNIYYTGAYVIDPLGRYGQALGTFSGWSIAKLENIDTGAVTQATTGGPVPIGEPIALDFVANSLVSQQLASGQPSLSVKPAIASLPSPSRSPFGQTPQLAPSPNPVTPTATPTGQAGLIPSTVFNLTVNPATGLSNLTSPKVSLAPITTPVTTPTTTPTTQNQLNTDTLAKIKTAVGEAICEKSQPDGCIDQAVKRNKPNDDDLKKVKAIATLPDSWSVRIGADRPQLVILYGGEGKSTYRCQQTIPWYYRPSGYKPNLPSFRKGKHRGCLELADNSKIVVFGSSKNEARRVINALKAHVDPKKLAGAKNIVFSVDDSIIQRRVIVKRIDFYPFGQKNSDPSWSIDYD